MEQKNSLFNTQQFVNDWKIYTHNAGIIISNALAVGIVFVLGLVAYELVGSYDAGISGILIFAFVFFPLLYGFQITIAKICSGHNANYNDLYKNFKVYFKSNNFGVYRVITNVLLTFLVGVGLTYLSWVLYDFIYNGALTNIMNELVQIAQTGDETLLLETYNKIFELDNYAYFYITPLALAFLFFFKRIKNRTILTYFNVSVIVPTPLSNNIYKRYYMNHRSEIKKDFRLTSLVIDAIYVVTLALSEFLVLNFVTLQYLEIYLIVILGITIVVTSIFAPLILIDACFIADKNQMNYLSDTKRILERQARQMQDMVKKDQDTAKKLDEIFDKLKEEHKEDSEEYHDDSEDQNSDDENN